MIVDVWKTVLLYYAVKRGTNVVIQQTHDEKKNIRKMFLRK